MKKYPIIILCLVICAVTCCGCDQRASDVDWTKRVNYYQTAYYCGGVTGLNVNISVGQQEETPVIDGNVGKLIPFARLTVVPLTAQYVTPEYTFELTGETGKISGKLIKEVFGSSFYVDLDKFDSIGAPTSVRVTYGETIAVDIPLADKMADKLTYDQALDIAVREYADQLSSDTSDTCVREISLRFAGDKRNVDNPYYWYVTIATSPEEYMALLIDSQSGKVITKKS